MNKLLKIPNLTFLSFQHSYRMSHIPKNMDTTEYIDSIYDVQEKVKRLAELISKSNRIVAFTGAGISTLSGIPDFRSGYKDRKSVV